MPPYPLMDVKIQKYHSEPKFDGVYSKNSLPKIKDLACNINLDECTSVGTYSVALCVNGDNVTYFDSFKVEYIPKEIEKFIGNKNFKTNIYRIQVNGSVICGYFSIRFIDSMLKVKILLDYTNLFSPNKYEKNDEIILKCFH